MPIPILPCTISGKNLENFQAVLKKLIKNEYTGPAEPGLCHFTVVKYCLTAAV